MVNSNQRAEFLFLISLQHSRHFFDFHRLFGIPIYLRFYSSVIYFALCHSSWIKFREKDIKHRMLYAPPTPTPTPPQYIDRCEPRVNGGPYRFAVVFIAEWTCANFYYVFAVKSINWNLYPLKTVINKFIGQFYLALVHWARLLLVTSLLKVIYKDSNPSNRSNPLLLRNVPEL